MRSRLYGQAGWASPHLKTDQYFNFSYFYFFSILGLKPTSVSFTVLSLLQRFSNIGLDIRIVGWNETLRCLLNPLGKIVGFGSTRIPVQLCCNSNKRVFESVSKSSAPASMKKPSLTWRKSPNPHPGSLKNFSDSIMCCCMKYFGGHTSTSIFRSLKESYQAVKAWSCVSLTCAGVQTWIQWIRYKSLSVTYLSFEEDFIDVSRLSVLAPSVHLLDRNREVVRKDGRRS